MEPSGLHALWGGLNANTEKQVWDVALGWDLSLQRGQTAHLPQQATGSCVRPAGVQGAAPPPPTVNCEPLACKVHSSHSDSLDGDLETLTTALHASSGT